MPGHARLTMIGAFALILLLSACSRSLTPEQKAQLAALKQEQATLSAEIDSTKADDAKYSGGLIKSLIGVRLELLKTNQALIQQRIHVLEGGAKTDVVVTTGVADPAIAAALAKDIAAQREKLAQAQAESAKYSGGLVKALADATVATIANSLAMLDQARLRATYGISMPEMGRAPPSGEASNKPVAPEVQGKAPPANSLSSCLKFGDYDSSVLQANTVYTEVAWKADVVNSCPEAFNISVVFTLSDKDDFELDSDRAVVHIDGNSTGKARGKMLVSPPEKARRMAKQGVSMAR